MIKWLVFAGALCAAVVLSFYAERKHRMLRMLCSGIITLNLIMFIFLIVDDYVPQTCADVAHFYDRQPFCVFQAFVTIGGIVFVTSAMMGISFQLWATVVLKVIARAHRISFRISAAQVDTMTLKHYEKWGTVGGVSFALLAPIIALGGDNLGFDWQVL
jgi:hypothetical protein